MQDTSRRIHSPERALRSTKHLHSVHVESGKTLQSRIRQDDFVYEQRYGGRRVRIEVIRSQSADKDPGIDRTIGCIDTDVGGPTRQIPDVGNIKLVEHLGAQAAHGGRHILQRLAPLLRRHHDLFQLTLGAGGRRNQHEGKQQSSHQARTNVARHQR